MLLKLAGQSLYNRRFSAGLSVLVIALSLSMLLLVESLRSQARVSFSQSLSGTDLVVGARGGALALLLYSVFHLGEASNNLSYASFELLAKHPAVAWAVPLSLGDSHRGFRVVGTNQDYVEHYAYGQQRHLELAEGQWFTGLQQVVLGSEVARQLAYQLGTSLTLNHGLQASRLTEHQQPFRVVGILKPTGTAVDRSLHLSLESLEAIHLGWQQGMPSKRSFSPEQLAQISLKPKAVTAVLLGLKSRMQSFELQRDINQYRSEPLTAIFPGVALQELWQLTGSIEQLLRLMSILVVLVGLCGMLIALWSSLNERRREMAILRAVGMSPAQVFVLLVSEASLITLLGSLVGLVFWYLSQWLALDWLAGQGIFLQLGWPGLEQGRVLVLVQVAGLVLGCLPAALAYRRSLMDGISIRF